MEKRIVDLDIAIRSALHHEEPDMARSLILISELHSLAIQPLMLKKLPNIVMTLRKVRKYIGPKIQQSDPKVMIKFTLCSEESGLGLSRTQQSQYWGGGSLRRVFSHLGPMWLDRMV